MKQVGHLGTGIHKLLKAVILTEINIPIFVPVSVARSLLSCPALPECNLSPSILCATWTVSVSPTGISVGAFLNP